MSNNQPISQDLLNQFQMIQDFFRKNYPEMTDEVEILARLSKIGEEFGELTSEVHDKLGFHKLSVHKHPNPENLPKEWADLFNTVILMGLVLELDINTVISSKMKYIFERYGLVQEENNPEIIQDWTAHPTGKIAKGTFCDHCGRFNARNMTVTVIGIQDDKILLIKRKRDPEAGAWAMPGGYVDWNETLQQCGIREFKEETGMDITDVKFLGLYDALNRDKDGRQNVDHCFAGLVPKNQKFDQNDDEVSDMQWFSFDNLPDTIAFDHRQMINDYLRQKE